MSTQRPSTEDIKRQLNMPGFKNVTPIHRLSDPLQDTAMAVNLDDLRPYEYNPRYTRNPMYDDIKASIRARGLDQPPTITRRPGQDFYIIRNGGNTRLAILNELYQETGSTLYYKVPCLFKPWKSEVSVLAGHLAENELRGELSFIEKAKAVAHMKRLYEKEENAANPSPLSLSALEKKLRVDGYPLSLSHISRMQDCLNSLYPAIKRTLEAGMGKNKIETLLKLKRELNRIWKKYDDGDFLSQLWLMVLSNFDDGEPNALNLKNIEDEMLGTMSKLLLPAFPDITDADALFRHLSMDLHLLRRGESLAQPEPGEVPLPEEAFQQDLDIAEAQENEEESPAAAPAHPPVAAPPRERPVLNPPPTPVRGLQARQPLPPTQPAPSLTEQPPPDKPQAIRKAAELTEEQQQAHIESHVVSPLQSSAMFRAMEMQAAAADGVELPDFAENVLKAIPVMAGGGLSEVSDLWYIDPRLDGVQSLRREMTELAKDIARWGQVKGLRATEGGFGFACEGLQHEDSPRACTAARLLSAIGAVHEQASGAEPLSAALFIQMLSGAFPAHSGAQHSKHSGLERLPDVEFVKLLRLFRLARRLVDLQQKERQEVRQEAQQED